MWSSEIFCTRISTLRKHMKNKTHNIAHEKRYIGEHMMKIRLDKTCIDTPNSLSTFSMASLFTIYVWPIWWYTSYGIFLNTNNEFLFLCSKTKITWKPLNCLQRTYMWNLDNKCGVQRNAKQLKEKVFCFLKNNEVLHHSCLGCCLL